MLQERIRWQEEEGRVSAAAAENELGQMRDVCTGELDQVSR